MKRVSHKKGILHVETALGIINIHVGLTDSEGRSVERVEIIPDRFMGEQTVVRVGDRLVRSKDSKDVSALEQEDAALLAQGRR